jgi:hypothetical protein
MFYWPALFVLTHVPMPRQVQAAHVGDKGLHFVAYFLLVLLIWGAVKPDERVRWNRATVWWVLLVLCCYGAADEWSQGWIQGRSADVVDYCADVGAALAGLLLLTLLPFWPALLWGVALAIFVVSAWSKGDLTSKLPLTTVLVHVLSFSLFTVLWLLYLSRSSRDMQESETPLWRRLGIAPAGRWGWGWRSLAVPLALLATVKLGAVVLNRAFPLVEVGAAAATIGLWVGMTAFFATVRDRLTGLVRQG